MTIFPWPICNKEGHCSQPLPILIWVWAGDGGPTGGPPSGGSGGATDAAKKEVNDRFNKFFKKNPGCKDLFKKMADPSNPDSSKKNLFDRIDKIRENVEVVDVNRKLDLLNTNVGTLQINLNLWTGLKATDPLAVLLGLTKDAAIADYGGTYPKNRIFLGLNFRLGLDEDGRNSAVIHELMHIAFEESDHIKLANKLSAPIGANATDDDASQAIQDFLENNCNNPPRK